MRLPVRVRSPLSAWLPEYCSEMASPWSAHMHLNCQSARQLHHDGSIHSMTFAVAIHTRRSYQRPLRVGLAVVPSPCKGNPQREATREGGKEARRPGGKALTRPPCKTPGPNERVGFLQRRATPGRR